MTRGTGWFCRPQSFVQEALCCGRVLLGREEKVEGGAGRILRTIQVAPLALDPDVGFVHPPTRHFVKSSLTKRLSVVAPEFSVHVNHHQKDTIPGYTAELGYQVGQLRAE
jgi:hypothetical protein